MNRRSFGQPRWRRIEVFRQWSWVGLVAGAVLLPVCARADIARKVDNDGTVTLSNSASRQFVAVKNRLDRDEVAAPISRYDAYIRQAALLYQIPEHLVRAVIMVESGFNPRATSKADARGLMRLVPSTASRMLVDNVFDPRQNIYGGVRYLRVLANLFNGNLILDARGLQCWRGCRRKIRRDSPLPGNASLRRPRRGLLPTIPRADFNGTPSQSWLMTKFRSLRSLSPL